MARDPSWEASEATGAGYKERMAAAQHTAATPVERPAAAAAPQEAPVTPLAALAPAAGAGGRIPVTPPDSTVPAAPVDPWVGLAEQHRAGQVAEPPVEAKRKRFGEPGFEELKNGPDWWTVNLDPNWRPEPTSILIEHWTCGRMPVSRTRPYDRHFGHPKWVKRTDTRHASGYKIFIGDLPPYLTVHEFRTQWLVNSKTLRRALTEICPSSYGSTEGPHLFDINVRMQADSGDSCAILTFNGQMPTAAEKCMEVFLEWWRPGFEGGWEPLKVKWLMTAH